MIDIYSNWDFFKKNVLQDLTPAIPEGVAKAIYFTAISNYTSQAIQQDWTKPDFLNQIQDDYRLALAEAMQIALEHQKSQGAENEI